MTTMTGRTYSPGAVAVITGLVLAGSYYTWNLWPW